MKPPSSSTLYVSNSDPDPEKTSIADFQNDIWPISTNFN